MPQRVRKLRFPDGDSEHRSTEVELLVGSTVRCRGATWVVASVTETVALLEPIPDELADGAASVGVPGSSMAT